VVSINPPDGSYQVATLDRALLDRMVILQVESDYACWARYARARELDAEVRRFLGGNSHLLARQGLPFELPIEPTERAWEMVSILRRRCRFPAELEMEVYAGIVGKEAAVMFLRWCSEQRERPVTAAEVLDLWPEVAAKASAQRDDLQAVTLSEVVAVLEGGMELTAGREANLVAYIAVLPRDQRFGLVKALARIPEVAAAITQDKYDAVVLEAIAAISAGV
jgi:hypothetical protein